MNLASMVDLGGEMMNLASIVDLGGDADILTDYISPPYGNGPNAAFFTYTGLRSLVGAQPSNFTVYKASMTELPSLNGQSVSYAALYYPPGSVNPPHTHPRSSELLFLLVGSLEVGFVDSNNKLIAQTLQQSDMFVFPKGLLHYQYNLDNKNPAIALSAFGSANAGTVSIPSAVFGSDIYDPILALSFNTDAETIRKLKSGITN
ncbi:hypothetical protein CDL12_12504 [Handroanthus impetiginosus]|uniref:Germin-like protein n=1 Tax=Handroanthus impetiginosus TaxID=429701 RepID=A0A2G9HBG5_9LAMI|nr:hypothetical protein CDL12_12504 [Handroanthus impetiginosus]